MIKEDIRPNGNNELEKLNLQESEDGNWLAGKTLIEIGNWRWALNKNKTHTHAQNSELLINNKNH